MVWGVVEDGAEDVKVTSRKVAGLSVARLLVPAEVSVVVLFPGISLDDLCMELEPAETIVSGSGVLIRAKVIEVEATALR